MRKSIGDAVLFILFLLVSYILLCALPAAQGQWSATNDDGVVIEIVSEYPYVVRADLEQDIAALRAAKRRVCGHVQQEIVASQDTLIWFRCKLWQTDGLFRAPRLYIQTDTESIDFIYWLSVTGPEECGLMQFSSRNPKDVAPLWHREGYTKTWIAFPRVFKPEQILEVRIR
ncbi:MAG: hypothetical protein KJ970_13325 [Candidatus Eisenbacteria bacterium]|uniref:Uncharacterized protein n=1 Tax=Eiseniibacteriota bacterium TaxID=2212470 RepID=A0A948RVP6_UNCEI|nr:hypothetical protein [Candidatus Eisenbacteria bacterium]MBU1947897.1 hypothetical protein [Candidatus Eisenbacteria bacterium]MBU2691895.1 hypothetical protein [Candidatus Eisenbacteria bacterium]